ncbi:MAG: VWA domain-containing protein [Proteobacteria bacterium]|nr:VWA domain-containing protein [Pseudomonadota bacterium]MBI3496810.1 VWA domain-containing protein [Pseudomonadota bacterium]
MFTQFFLELRQARVPATLNEYLTLIEAMQAGIARHSIEDFYYLARASLVKDEANLDKFDRVFGRCFNGIETLDLDLVAEIPEAWLKKLAETLLSEEEKAKIEALGGWDKLMATLRQRLAEQKGRHQGGSKWIGTAGTSPFGAYGYNPEGVRIGQEESRNRRAVKVWDRREYKNLDDTVELGTRNIKVALRKLRRFAREGAASELDLPGTIRSTAHNAGWLDLKLVPERHNTIKVLLFLDAGGSMDDHVRVCEELFSAVRAEFKRLEYFYFHNCPYEWVWRDNRRRFNERTSTLEVMRSYGADYKLVFVGDASMSAYEIVRPGGSVEHYNDEPGQIWMQRLTQRYTKAIWLNPVPEERWGYTQSIRVLERLMAGRMFPLTLDGLDRGIRLLNR